MKVFISKTDNYDYDKEKLYHLIRERLDNVFGENYFQDKKRVLIKPNLLMNAEPHEAITTHPNFILALAHALKDKGTKVFLADNPGGFTSVTSVSEIYTTLGLDKFPETLTLLSNDKPPYAKNQIPFSWWTKGFDAVINLPKLKTHDLMLITAAVKNTYGFVQGMKKSSLHKDFPKPDDFARILVDIFKMFKPQINILDAIVSLEGEGPAKKGTPKKRGLIVFSDSAWALDWVLCKLIKIDPEKIPYIRLGLTQHLFDPSQIQIEPEDWQKFKINDFIFAPPTILATIPRPVLKLAGTLLSLKPVINTSVCKICKKCIETCPVAAIKINQKKQVEIDYSRCIKCLCCREVCPYAAVDVEYSLLYKLLKSILGAKPKTKETLS
ncbi:MAG: DUF362 domain-containing protein [Candidatus Omnitrophica bacterium]|nr:DUF362 domain-containing protein [Candidatus Omnitrophota bacterium]